MYLALLLTPWVLMYALSTMAMNHRQFFDRLQTGPEPAFEKESETVYRGTFDPAAKPRDIARQIVKDLEIDGRYYVRKEPDGKLVIFREDPLHPRRITFTPASGQLVVERQLIRTRAFLEELHRSRGWSPDYPLRNPWAFSVDLAIAAMIFWVASGIWMWLELSGTRRWGIVFASAGLVLFVLFLATI
jgi:hypothetical protein